VSARAVAEAKHWRAAGAWEAMPLKLDRLNIMIVDDNPHMRILVRDILLGFGVKNVLECSEGSQAISELKHWPADIVLVDWMMEPLDGVDFTRLIRTASDSPNPYLPIIMLTGHTERFRVAQARDAGVTEFLAKPVTANGLYARIRAIIEHPRPFVKVGHYMGPCRRRKLEDFSGEGRREADQGPVEETSAAVQEGLADTAAMIDKLTT
jgi:two-component system chemotaxis response regulator CheY